MGGKKKPYYRVVAADSRSPRDGRFLETLGSYDPRSEPSRIEINEEKALKWLREGAQPTSQVRKLMQIKGIWQKFQEEKSGK